MSPIDVVMMTLMVSLCIIMLYYTSRLIRDDPGFWGAALDKKTWLKMWNFGEKLQPEENTALLQIQRKKREKEKTVAES